MEEDTTLSYDLPGAKLYNSFYLSVREVKIGGMQMGYAMMHDNMHSYDDVLKVYETLEEAIAAVNWHIDEVFDRAGFESPRKITWLESALLLLLAIDCNYDHSDDDHKDTDDDDDNYDFAKS